MFYLQAKKAGRFHKEAANTLVSAMNTLKLMSTTVVIITIRLS